MGIPITPKPIDAPILLLICFIAFLVCACIAVSEAVQQTRLMFFGVRTDATCARAEMRGEGRRRSLSYTFRFTDKAGATIEVEDIWCTEGTKKGDVVSIVYLPSDPKIVSLSGMKGWGFLVFIGTIAVLVGIFLLHWLR